MLVFNLQNCIEYLQNTMDRKITQAEISRKAEVSRNALISLLCNRATKSNTDIVLRVIDSLVDIMIEAGLSTDRKESYVFLLDLSLEKKFYKKAFNK